MTAFTYKAMEIAMTYGNATQACGAHDIHADLAGYQPIMYASLSHDALLRQALEALESCDGDDGLQGYRQFYDEKLVEPAIAACKQALEPK